MKQAMLGGSGVREIVSPWCEALVLGGSVLGVVGRQGFSSGYSGGSLFLLRGHI